jgi:predicted RNA binding protein with dsRBD fold (UPF0201 family)
MNIPSLKCKIEILCSINPSEDPKKVKSAILNIFPNCELETQRRLEKNLDKNSTWFYLNKQAAFVEKIAICEESDESPLGPIKVILTSNQIDRIIDWLIHYEQ